MTDRNATQDEISAACAEVVEYLGRQPFDEVKDKEPTDFSCFQHRFTDLAGDANQPISSSLCKKCPNGMRGEAVYGPVDKKVSNIEWFDKQVPKLDMEKYKVCKYVRIALPKQLQAKILVAPTAAYSTAMNYHKSESGRIQRLIIIDENVVLNRRVEITEKHVAKWINRVEKTIINSKSEVWLRTLSALQKLKDGFENGLFADKTTDAYNDFAKELLSVKKEHNDRKLIVGGLARFETIRFYREENSPDDKKIVDKFSIPLHAFADLATAMEIGTIDLSTNVENKPCLVIHVLTQIANRLINAGRVIFTDATMPDELQELIKFSKGRVVSLNVDQYITAKRVSKDADGGQGYSYSRGLIDLDSPRKFAAITKDMLEYATILKNWSTNGLPWAMMTHKAVWDELATVKGLKIQDSDKDIFNAPILREFFNLTGGKENGGVKAGWFQRHDRGHNIWKDHNIAIFGQTSLSDTNIMKHYDAARSIMLVCGNQTWGKWDGQMTNIKTGSCIPVDTPDIIDESGRIIKHGSKTRNWYYNFITSNIIQAIGRSRAVAAKQKIECFLFGGIDNPELDANLAEYGVHIEEERVVNTVHRTRKMHYERGSKECEVEIEAMNMYNNNKPVSKASLFEKIKAQGKIAMSSTAIGNLLKTLRKEGKLPPATMGGKSTHKSYISEHAKTDSEVTIEPKFEPVELTPELEVAFQQQNDDRFFSGERDFHEDVEFAILTIDDITSPVLKVDTIYYRESLARDDLVPRFRMFKTARLIELDTV